MLCLEMTTNKIPTSLFTDADNPPDYTPYNAEFVLKNDGTVVSHDSHLNTDGLLSTLSSCHLH